MKRIILAFALCGIATAAWSQSNFPEYGNSAAELFTEKDMTPVTAEADINKDGIKDLVIAAPEIYDGLSIAFYFGQKEGGYGLFRAYSLSLPEKTGITVTNQGVVRFQCDIDGGSDIFLFRYEKGDFRLIGGKKDRHASEHYDESYNYLTGKMIRTDGEGGSRKSVTTDMPKMPVINFGWIPLKYDMLGYLLDDTESGPSDTEDMLVMGIFRRMQDEEMLFWHFCDYENPYRNPSCAEDGTWYADDEHMSPGSYNAWSSLEIAKLEDGAYRLDLSETTQDRSYEALFNEDLSNVDEIMEEYGAEEESSRSCWIFRDGIFYVQDSAQ